MKRFAFVRACLPLSLSGLLALSACGSEGPMTLADPASFAAFSEYCVGTLLVEAKVMTASPPGSWIATSDQRTPAGGRFFVGTDFAEWRGFAFGTGGAPLQLEVGQDGLVQDTDFTSTCADDSKRANHEGHVVLMAPATFHARADLSDAACTLERGTELTSFSYMGGVPGSTVTGDAITSTCGYATAYSSDITWGELITVL